MNNNKSFNNNTKYPSIFKNELVAAKTFESDFKKIYENSYIQTNSPAYSPHQKLHKRSNTISQFDIPLINSFFIQKLNRSRMALKEGFAEKIKNYLSKIRKESLISGPSLSNFSSFNWKEIQINNKTKYKYKEQNKNQNQNKNKLSRHNHSFNFSGQIRKIHNSSYSHHRRLNTSKELNLKKGFLKKNISTIVNPSCSLEINLNPKNIKLKYPIKLKQSARISQHIF